MRIDILFSMLLFTLVGCQSEEQPKTYNLSVIIDLSDTDNYKPSAEEILSFMPNMKHSDGLTIRLRYVTETRYSDTYSFTLETGVMGLLSNEDQRRRKRKRLLKSFRDSLSHLNSNHVALKRSEIFGVISDELKILSNREGERIVLIFGDLKQHSAYFSVYRKHDVHALVNNPEAITKRFADQFTLADNLSGINMHILNTPKLEDDKVFTAMVRWYRSLLEPKGVKVNVGFVHHISK